MTLAEELKARGLVEDFSAPVEQILSQNRTVYVGVDPTADSMHVGHLVPILLMKRLGAVGHKLIFLVGGATGMIGDPKEKGERTMLDEETIAANTRALKAQLKSVLGETKFEMVDNADWLGQVKLIPFLRDVGKHFTVNNLIKREIIKKRLENPDDSISYTEFTYALLQGLDFLTLNEKYRCDLQVGASDQWTNILSGVDLIRKKLGKDAYAFTVPLVTDSTGKKFGKSEGNAVWLDTKKTSPFQFYQFWINLPDEDVEKYLKVYTFLPLEEITVLMDKHKAAPAEREAQETLARLVTEIVHGPAAAAQVAAATDALFGGTPFSGLSAEARTVALAEAPSIELTKQDIEGGSPLSEILVKGGLASSKSDVRRLIEGRGIFLNDFAIENPDQKIFPGDLPGGHALIRKGKQGVLVLVLK
ncbi:tyrosine--tRNA ligase [Candidatus Kaiserbacteria bacterium RIFCSPHIGHO2_01_FULL_53_31]|uniref:Tyrosine--tRNA ligase n=1 Tax=Candidatus Kaiserbacteria bacterium RIFCSPHIGHO2_01_FULL_53_31 TaxID=1798481 RepID=A0A1F6CH52_9BACT|nr:MAG: tyrosine--tRNA ligase [Candidatus Kaiserbacteria bacterium RIFCSPHIGHO2_01_FULL_53_31]